MIVVRPADARGHAEHGWLDSWHTFSFARYHDPAWMGFGALRVLNEDRVAPGGGFAPHRHANMEILSIVLSGALAHRDSSGGEGVLRPGEVQWMSAGHGIEHSEFNASAVEPVHFLQVWIQPDRVNAPPAYAQRTFDPAARDGAWQTIAAPDGAGGSLAIRQDARVRLQRLAPGATATLACEAGRRCWLHVVSGSATCGQHALQSGGAIGLAHEPAPLSITASDAGAELLAFDLPG